MRPYQIALKSLSGIQISPDNKYIRELEQVLEGASTERRTQVLVEIATYFDNPSISTPLPSGVIIIDRFIENYLDSAEKSEKVQQTRYQPGQKGWGALVSTGVAISQGLFDLEQLSFEDRKTLGQFFKDDIRIRAHPAVMGHSQYQETLRKFLVYLIDDCVKEGVFNAITLSGEPSARQSDSYDLLYDLLRYKVRELQPIMTRLAGPNLGPNFSLNKDHALVRAYLHQKPRPDWGRKQYCRNVADAVAHLGVQWHYGGRPCPIESFRSEAIQKTGSLTRTHESFEFAYVVMSELEKARENALAEKVYEEFGEYCFTILKHGKKGYDFYDSFRDDQCAGCITGPPGCEFMQSHLEEVCRGLYHRQPCSIRSNGTARFVTTPDGQSRKLGENEDFPGDFEDSEEEDLPKGKYD